MKDVQELQNELIDLAVSWAEAFVTGDHQKANKQNSAITRVAKKFKKNKNIGEAVLTPLLAYPNPAVRLLASVHALDQNIQVQEAEVVLTSIATDSNIRLISLMAQINLSNWNKKKKAKQKDEPAD
jgi:hypothetical protein